MTSATYGAAPKTNDSVMVNKPSKVNIKIDCFFRTKKGMMK